MPRSSRLLAIDPGTHTGLALFEGRRLIHHAAVRMDAGWRGWERALAAVTEAGPAVVAVEDQWLPYHGAAGGGAGRNLLTLIRIAHTWRLTGMRAGAEVVLVRPCDWQRFIGARGRSPMRKQLAQALAAGMARDAGLEAPGPDASDAVCIGLYAQG